VISLTNNTVQTFQYIVVRTVFIRMRAQQRNGGYYVTRNFVIIPVTYCWRIVGS